MHVNYAYAPVTLLIPLIGTNFKIFKLDVIYYMDSSVRCKTPGFGFYSIVPNLSSLYSLS